jgi:hypothetical protein
MPFTASTFQNGSYKDGNWFCACNRPAVWREVKKEGPTQGEHCTNPFPSPHETHTASYIATVVLRCKPSGAEPQCSFFLWEVHEASARSTLTQRASPQPTTPPSIRTSTLGTALYLPTPRTVGSVSTLPTRDRRLPPLDDSPTRHRGRNAVTSPAAADDEDDEDDEGTLVSQIVARLGTDGFQLKPSTKEYLGHILREEIAIYKAKLRTRDVTIARLSSKLDQLTVK